MRLRRFFTPIYFVCFACVYVNPFVDEADLGFSVLVTFPHLVAFFDSFALLKNDDEKPLLACTLT
jgi:hypothetical protein